MRFAPRHQPAFRLMLCAVLAFLPLMPSIRSGMASDLPFVFERVNEIAVITVKDSPHQRVVFFRDGKAFASRLLTDDMQWLMADGVFQLTWADYYSAVRIVESPRVSSWHMDADPTDQSGLAWFDARRVMTNLREPD